MAELVSFILRGVIEIGESKANDRLAEIEVAGDLAAMQSEDIWDGPVSKAAKKAVKKAEQELWQVLETLDFKVAWEAAKEIAKKKKEQKS